MQLQQHGEEKVKCWHREVDSPNDCKTHWQSLSMVAALTCMPGRRGLSSSRYPTLPAWPGTPTCCCCCTGCCTGCWTGCCCSCCCGATLLLLLLLHVLLPPTLQLLFFSLASSPFLGLPCGSEITNKQSNFEIKSSSESVLETINTKYAIQRTNIRPCTWWVCDLTKQLVFQYKYSPIYTEDRPGMLREQKVCTKDRTRKWENKYSSICVKNKIAD